MRHCDSKACRRAFDVICDVSLVLHASRAPWQPACFGCGPDGLGAARAMRCSEAYSMASPPCFEPLTPLMSDLCNAECLESCAVRAAEWTCSHALAYNSLLTCEWHKRRFHELCGARSVRGSMVREVSARTSVTGKCCAPRDACECDRL